MSATIIRVTSTKTVAIGWPWNAIIFPMICNTRFVNAVRAGCWILCLDHAVIRSVWKNQIIHSIETSSRETLSTRVQYDRKFRLPRLRLCLPARILSEWNWVLYVTKMCLVPSAVRRFPLSVPIVNRLELDQVCNRTDYISYWLSYDRLQCNSTCGHLRCAPGHKVENFRCGQYRSIDRQQSESMFPSP